MKIVYIIIVLLVIVSGIYFLNIDGFNGKQQSKVDSISQKENESDINLQLKGIDLPEEIIIKIKTDIKNKVIPKDTLEIPTDKLKPIKSSLLSDANFLQKGNRTPKNDHWDRKTAGFEIPDDQWDKMIKRYSENLDLNNEQDLTIKSSALMDMGLTKLMKRDFIKAEQAFTTIINKFPNSEIESKARIFLIETFRQQKKISEAARVIQAAYIQYGENADYVDLLDRFKIADTKAIKRQRTTKRNSDQTKKGQQTKQLRLDHNQSGKKNVHTNQAKPTFPGDLNHDGVLNEKDSLCAYELALSICPTSCGKECNIKLCDINGDNKCTNADAICIYNKSLGLPCSNEALPGDMDKDGILTKSDALCAHELSLSICPTSCGKDCNINLCDVNADNKCTNEDVICIYNRSLGMECQ
jgi:TolA-binding protein